MAPILEDEEGIDRAIEREASDAPPSPFDFSVASSEMDMIKDSLLEVREC